MTDQYFDADVVIIGYGPVGVSAANILGSYGIKTIVLERYKDIYSRARAVTVNDWTLRHFQSVGLADRLTRDMDETYALRTMTYDGQLLSHIRFPNRGSLGYATSYSIYQPAMEQTLRDGAMRFADHVEVRFGVEAIDVSQDADGVTVTTTELETRASATVRARYALACDGGSSATRERLGIELLGDTIETKWVIIDAFVKRWWPDRHILTFWSDKQRPAVDIALSLGTHRWELPLQPHETEADFKTHDQLWVLLNAMGVSRDDVELHQHAFYKHHVRHAERWREGRVLLLGDAAHLMPPWAGQGMQSGIRDAFNLCWKLKAVLAGSLTDTVLDTYEQERAPNVERITQFSAFSGRMVKQELTPDELAAVMPPPGVEPPPSPLLLPPAIDTGWLTGATGPEHAVGKMIPQPDVAMTNGRLARLDDVIGNGFVLLGDGVDPATVLTTAQRTAWDGLGASYRAVRSPDQASEAPGDIIDIEGTLLAWMRTHSARVLALRPDRFVAATDTSGLSVPGQGQCVPSAEIVMR
jgi:3-(3-hydroxy-phenyl)propionate hydroxylase